MTIGTLVQRYKMKMNEKFTPTHMIRYAVRYPPIATDTEPGWFHRKEMVMQEDENLYVLRGFGDTGANMRMFPEFTIDDDGQLHYYREEVAKLEFVYIGMLEIEPVFVEWMGRQEKEAVRLMGARSLNEFVQDFSHRINSAQRKYLVRYSEYCPDFGYFPGGDEGDDLQEVFPDMPEDAVVLSTELRDTRTLTFGDTPYRQVFYAHGGRYYSVTAPLCT